MTKDPKKVAAGLERAKTLTRDHQIMAGKARAQHFTSAYQRFAQKCGTVARAEYRRLHPTDLERQMISWLAELGWTEGVHYEREKVIAGWCCDFVFEDRKAVIEVNGEVWHTNGFHGEDREARDARKRQDLRVYGWRLLEITQHRMRNKEQAQNELIHFLAGGHS